LHSVGFRMGGRHLNSSIETNLDEDIVYEQTVYITSNVFSSLDTD